MVVVIKEWKKKIKKTREAVARDVFWCALCQFHVFYQDVYLASTTFI
jgi:hypothetical protein